MAIKEFIDKKSIYAPLLGKQQLIDVLDEVSFKENFPFETIIKELEEAYDICKTARENNKYFSVPEAPERLYHLSMGYRLYYEYEVEDKETHNKIHEMLEELRLEGDINESISCLYNEDGFKKTFSFETTMAEIREIVTLMEKQMEKYDNVYYLGGTRLAHLVNGAVTYYPDRVNENINIAKELVEAAMSTDFNWYDCHTQLRYQPVSTNFANEMVSYLMNGEYDYPEPSYEPMMFRNLNKRLFMSVDSKEAIDMIKEYMETMDKSNYAVYLSYAVFSNPNIDDAYRNQLCQKTLSMVDYIGAYATNLTPEMKEMYKQSMLSCLINKSPEGEYFAKDFFVNSVPDFNLSVEGIKKFTEGLSERDRVLVLAQLYDFQGYRDIDADALEFIASEIKNSEIYKVAQDVLDESMDTKYKQIILEGLEDVENELNALLEEKEDKKVNSPIKEEQTAETPDNR